MATKTEEIAPELTVAHVSPLTLPYLKGELSELAAVQIDDCGWDNSKGR